jgi:site-specific recombinase XerD
MAPIEAWLRFLTETARSPNTVRAYAFDLRDFFSYIDAAGLDWRRVRIDDIGSYVWSLRLPAGADPGTVSVLTGQRCGSATINRKLAALAGFYRFHARRGVDVGQLFDGGDAGRYRGGTSWRPFLQDVGRQPRQRRRAVVLPTARPRPRTLTAVEIAVLLAACARLRDRFLLTLLHATGLRIGEALGLRHEDLDPSSAVVRVVPRTNGNHARAKSGRREVPMGRELPRLYADYLFAEYGDLDSDYVFVNLWGEPHGEPLTYSSVNRLFRRLRRDTGVHVEPHMFRHTYATGLLRAGVDVAVIARLLGHASATTTIDTYSHLDDADLTAALRRAGVLDEGPDT